MKEATGELNATVVVVITVATLVAFFYTIVWPSIRNNMNQNVACSKAICAGEPNADGRTVQCYVMENGKKSSEFTCAWKG